MPRTNAVAEMVQPIAAVTFANEAPHTVDYSIACGQLATAFNPWNSEQAVTAYGNGHVAWGNDITHTPFPGADCTSAPLVTYADDTYAVVATTSAPFQVSAGTADDGFGNQIELEFKPEQLLVDPAGNVVVANGGNVQTLALTEGALATQDQEARVTGALFVMDGALREAMHDAKAPALRMQNQADFILVNGDLVNVEGEIIPEGVGDNPDAAPGDNNLNFLVALPDGEPFIDEPDANAQRTDDAGDDSSRPSCRPAAGCADGDKRFFVTPPPDALRYNVLALATVYVLWSAGGHFVVWYTGRYHREYKWVDYAVTAPVMLSVLSASYNADSITALVVAPIALCVLIVIAGTQERRFDEPVHSRPLWVFVALVVVYGFVITPSLYAAREITTGAEAAPGELVGTGEAPSFVFVFAAVTVLVVFSSFAVLYAVDNFVVALSWRESGYLTLSLIAKTTLHLFIGLSVIESSNVVSDSASDDTSSDMDTLGAGLGGAAALVVGLALLVAYGRLADDTQPGGGAKTSYSMLTARFLL